MPAISVEDARSIVLNNVALLEAETVPLLEATGRAAAEDLRSDIDVSPFAHSAMDGYALFSADLANASPEDPVILDVVAEVPAGSVFEGVLRHGQCVRIMTGAPMPLAPAPADGTPEAACANDAPDAVVKYEAVEAVSGQGMAGGKVRFDKPVKPGDNVRKPGEDAKAGQVVVAAGEVISPAGCGFLAGCGLVQVPVRRRPRVAVIAIGSELVEPPALPGPGQIRNSNSYAIAASVQDAGGVPNVLPIVSDSLEDLEAVIKNAVDNHDFIVTTGGASNGDYDFIKPVVERLGTLLITNVNVRPGKAQTFGLIEGVPVFGLPGNPGAAYLGFELFIRPALLKMQGMPHLERPSVFARLTCDKKKKDPRRLYMRATLSKAADGSLDVTPAKSQGSGLFGIIQKSNCMAVIPEDCTFAPAGTPIRCFILDVPEGVVLPD
ncbi:MAG: molybdopterin molybdotransferase MoeA [Eggerthellales bacterium]|nr:molybdopterin molybdotransferase MoeA [Eggerthellales bacterium]